jgi:hypothetical protein
MAATEARASNNFEYFMKEPQLNGFKNKPKTSYP